MMNSTAMTNNNVLLDDDWGRLSRDASCSSNYDESFSSSCDTTIECNESDSISSSRCEGNRASKSRSSLSQTFACIHNLSEKLRWITAVATDEEEEEEEEESEEDQGRSKSSALKRWSDKISDVLCTDLMHALRDYNETYIDSEEENAENDDQASEEEQAIDDSIVPPSSAEECDEQAFKSSDRSVEYTEAEHLNSSGNNNMLAQQENVVAASTFDESACSLPFQHVQEEQGHVRVGEQTIPLAKHKSKRLSACTRRCPRRARSSGEEKLRHGMWPDTLAGFRKGGAAASMTTPSEKQRADLGYEDTSTNLGYEDSAPDLGYEDSAPDLGYGGTPSLPPPSEDILGYGDDLDGYDGDASSTNMFGYGECSMPSLGYGEAPLYSNDACSSNSMSCAALGYGDDDDEQSAMAYHSDGPTVAFRKQRGVRRRCSVTKYSLEAQQAAQKQIAEEEKRKMRSTQNQLIMNECALVEHADDDADSSSSNDEDDYTIYMMGAHDRDDGFC
jgi:hypothetical protein